MEHLFMFFAFSVRTTYFRNCVSYVQRFAYENEHQLLFHPESTATTVTHYASRRRSATDSHCILLREYGYSRGGMAMREIAETFSVGFIHDVVDGLGRLPTCAPQAHKG